MDVLLAKHASFISHKAELKSNRNDEDLQQKLLHEKEDAALIGARNSQNEQKLMRREVEDEGLERIGGRLGDQGAVSSLSNIIETSNIKTSPFFKWQILKHSSSYSRSSKNIC